MGNKLSKHNYMTVWRKIVDYKMSFADFQIPMLWVGDSSGCGSRVEPEPFIGRFDSPGLHVEVSLGKILNPKTAPYMLVGTFHGSHSCFG